MPRRYGDEGKTIASAAGGRSGAEAIDDGWRGDGALCPHFMPLCASGCNRREEPRRRPDPGRYRPRTLEGDKALSTVIRQRTHQRRERVRVGIGRTRALYAKIQW